MEDDGGPEQPTVDEAAIEGNTSAMLSAFQDDEGGGGSMNLGVSSGGDMMIGQSEEDGPGAGQEHQIEEHTETMLAQFAPDADPHEIPPAHSELEEVESAGAEAADAGAVVPSGTQTGKDGKQDEKLMKVKGMDKQQLCIDLLMVGCVQSFVDLFYITHRKEPQAENAVPEIESKDVEIPDETLSFLKETLEAAESARRGAKYQQCFESYNTLAEYFEKVPDLKSAVYFYQRCADVASEVDARESISKAFLNIGSCEEQAAHWQSAMQFHERALQIATSADSLPLQIKAASRLTQVYQVLAENCDKEGRDSEATALYERCKDCAQLSKDANLEGIACHKLGLSKYKTGFYDEAIDLQKQYLDICRMHDDRVGESAARAALAWAFEAVGSTQEAIKQLENLLNVAGETGELKAQASACLNLGILYNGRGDHEKSVELLEQHFDLARQIGDRKLIDSARVVLGMVRGNGKLKSYIDLVNNDLEKLLKWKSKRATLDS
mmetsp:Transcript_77118/g.160552  ORF Transcript_77118/g.160552 Transcript_77118/m.160552 type:complete len:495 (-) Transcript_77118:48-1532(-)